MRYVILYGQGQAARAQAQALWSQPSSRHH